MFSQRIFFAGESFRKNLFVSCLENDELVEMLHLPSFRYGYHIHFGYPFVKFGGVTYLLSYFSLGKSTKVSLSGKVSYSCDGFLIGFLRGVVISLIFPKVPQSSLGILRVPQLPPPLEHPP